MIIAFLFPHDDSPALKSKVWSLEQHDKHDEGPEGCAAGESLRTIMSGGAFMTVWSEQAWEGVVS
jgi:hypothetical protein